MPFQLDVVTVERSVYSEEVDAVTLPGSQGELGVLPHHAPLLTVLSYGDLHIRKGTQELDIAVGGGFLEVHPERVIILADMAERAEEIDVNRAETARKRAEEVIAQGPANLEDMIRAEASLRRAETRLRIARRRGGGSPSMDSGTST